MIILKTTFAWHSQDVSFGWFARKLLQKRSPQRESFQLECRRSSGPGERPSASTPRHAGHCVDLGESFQFSSMSLLNLLFKWILIPTHMYLQTLASIQPRTSPVKFVASRDKPRGPLPCRDLPEHLAAPADVALVRNHASSNRIFRIIYFVGNLCHDFRN